MSPPDGEAEIRRLIRDAETVVPEPPRPLVREIPPADPFPVDALGSVLASAARAINDRVQAPTAICGQSVLGAATLAVQGYADVILPIGQSHRRPVSDYYISLAESGERKSASDAEAMRPIRTFERALAANYDQEMKSYHNDKAAWEAARAKAIKDGKGNRAAIKTALDAIGPAPIQPLLPMLTCAEVPMRSVTPPPPRAR